MAEDAYGRYAIEANQGTANLATFRAIAKKYPGIPPEQVLRDLIASTPGAEGKWFAAARDASLFDVAIELVTYSPADPRTLARAVRDFAASQPEFAVAAGLASLRWISCGHGYDITGLDVLDTYSAVMQAAPKAGADAQQVTAQIRNLLSSEPVGNQFMKTVLAHHLTGWFARGLGSDGMAFWLHRYCVFAATRTSTPAPETPSWCRRQSIRTISLHVSLTERTATDASNQPFTTGADDVRTASSRDRVVAGQRPGTLAYHRRRRVRKQGRSERV